MMNSIGEREREEEEKEEVTLRVRNNLVGWNSNKWQYFIRVMRE